MVLARDSRGPRSSCSARTVAYGVSGSSNSGRFQQAGQMWLSELGMYHRPRHLIQTRECEG
jgi:hypothetical protein